MYRESQKTYLSELAEELAKTWSKTGAKISWSEEETSVPSEDRVFPVCCGGRVVGDLICELPEELAGQSEGLHEIFRHHLEQIQRNYQGENELVSLSQELSGSYEELSLIYKLGQDMQITDDPGTYLKRFSEDLLELIHARGLLLLVNHRLNGDESCVEIGTLPVTGESARAVGRYLQELTGGLNEAVILSDLSPHPSLVRIFKTSSMGILAWPVRSNGLVLGLLVAFNADPEMSFDSTDAKFLGSIAEHTGSFLQNRFLLGDIQELLTGFLTSLVNAIDAKDPYTRGHSQRVAFIGQRIAESMGLSKKECSQIFMAGLLHDIGKIGVNDQVLAKPGKLTKEEFASVQEHPVIGSRIISAVRQLRNILPGILTHHERYDGKGYSEGLAGEQIPLMGMIVGLADSFDAITSERTYHSARNFKDALDEVRKCSGTQFSPGVVQALLDCDLENLERDLAELAHRNPESRVHLNFNWLE
jgi:HD-GYP domain-containing protein (c-di-GMP phosphodiesterase class II)